MGPKCGVRPKKPRAVSYDVERTGLMSKYQPAVNMPERVVASYWEGALTRGEAQRVFDEYGKGISGLAGAVQRLDMCLAYLCEKFGIEPKDVSEWAVGKAKLASEAEKGTIVTN